MAKAKEAKKPATPKAENKAEDKRKMFILLTYVRNI